MALTFDRLKEILATNQAYLLQEEDGSINQKKPRLNIVELHKKAQDCNEDLIDLLVRHDNTRNKFFLKRGEHQVFLRDRFIDYINHKDFFANSYTKYKNKIGLSVDLGNGSQYLKKTSQVVLDFPFKDCVLEGGQTQDDEKRGEIYFNEVLADSEIDRLLDPKVLTNATKIYRGSHCGKLKQTPIGEFKRDQHGTIKDNLIIKGNNLLVLHTLKQQLAGKVKLIYIDPPYNTGNDSFNYNDNFNHSTWLVFMKNRLQVARELLRDDGVIFVQCDDNEQAYLKVLMDEVFGRDEYQNTFYIQVRYEGKTLTEKNDFQKIIEIIHIYSKNHLEFKVNKEKEEYSNKRFIWKIEEGDVFKEIILGGKQCKIFKNYKITRSRESFDNLKETWASGTVLTGNTSGKYFDKHIANRVTEDGLNCLYKVKGVGEDGLGYRYFTGPKREGATQGKFYSGVPLIRKKEISNNQVSYKEKSIVNFYNMADRFGNCRLEGLAQFNAGKKPEILLERILQIATQPNDIVLDYHLGSGTTAAVAHKMGRQYIGVEQMDYIEDIAVERLKKVIGTNTKPAGELLPKAECDQGGISKAVNWQGGGEFIYLELKKYNQQWVAAIDNANNSTELLQVRQAILEKGFIDYRLNVTAIKHDNDFQALELIQQKKILFDCLDKNQLYINYSERHDTMHQCTQAEIKTSQAFYKAK